MPVKKPDLARIRNNQRRSRAQRNERIHNLEERVREYELRGVQASISLQVAARAVVRENARLRSLLRQRGVEDNEVEAYLKANMHETDDRASTGISALSILPSSVGSICSQKYLTTSSSSTSHQKPMTESSQQDSALKDQRPNSASALNGREDVDTPQKSTFRTAKEDHPIENHVLPSQEHAVRHYSPTEVLEDGKVIRNNMTSCREAAMIIVGMNGGLSTEEAKAELGCPPVNDCYVDNLTVFQAMDR